MMGTGAVGTTVSDGLFLLIFLEACTDFVMSTAHAAHYWPGTVGMGMTELLVFVESELLRCVQAQRKSTQFPKDSTSVGASHRVTNTWQVSFSVQDVWHLVASSTWG